MNKDQSIGLLVVLGIIGIALFSGSKGASNNGLIKNSSRTPVQQQKDIAKEIKKTQTEVDKLKKQVQAEEDKKTQSKYKGVVTLGHVNKSKLPAQEYIAIQVSSRATTTINVTGWTLKSTNTGAVATIPKGTYLYFANSVNTEDDIYLSGGDILYLITGTSPIGVSFKVNECSGYLTQFQKFTPYINNICPIPKKEVGYSSITKIFVNDACLDYVDAFPRCKVQTKNLPVNWSYECTHFIYDKLNYPSCVNTHKGDKDFYQRDWRVYLKRSARLWKDRRENIILYDNEGKIVSTLTY